MDAKGDNSKLSLKRHLEREGTTRGIVLIRNPWGGPENSTSGTIAIPLSTFISDFAYLVYTKKSKT